MDITLSNFADHPSDVIAAIAALGTAAYGLVDVLKTFWGGISRVGYGDIEDALMPFDPALKNAIGPDWGNIIFSHWLNGVPLDDQKTKAKTLIRLGLDPYSAREITGTSESGEKYIYEPRYSRPVGPFRLIRLFRRRRRVRYAPPSIDGGALADAAKKLTNGEDLVQRDINVLGRFDATIDAALDAAYDRADQEYRNAARGLAAVIAVVLALTADWLMSQSGPHANYLLAVLVGLIAVPLAPIAKDLSSALATAVKAMGAVQGQDVLNIYFLNYHFDSTSGGTRGVPEVLYGEGDAAAPGLGHRFMDDLATAMRGNDVVFVTHGFNTPFIAGVRAIGRFAGRLTVPERTMIVGVLWPGDFHVPYLSKLDGINYPTAWSPAVKSGVSLAGLCNGPLSGANSFSFVSHSLGARVVLEAVQGMRARARLLCVTAGAVNDDCLSAQYKQAAGQAVTTRVLASRKDMVLQVLFRIGDPFAQAFELVRNWRSTGHDPFHRALGRLGPDPDLPPPVYRAQIAEAEDYGHGNYLAPPDENYRVPPLAPAPPAIGQNKWLQVAGFVSSALAGNTPAWPPAWTPPVTLRSWDWGFTQWRGR